MTEQMNGLTRVLRSEYLSLVYTSRRLESKESKLRGLDKELSQRKHFLEELLSKKWNCDKTIVGLKDDIRREQKVVDIEYKRSFIDQYVERRQKARQKAYSFYTKKNRFYRRRSGKGFGYRYWKYPKSTLLEEYRRTGRVATLSRSRIEFRKGSDLKTIED